VPEKLSSPPKIRCDACPVMCYIAENKSGACDRYANENGELIRVDPLTVIEYRNEGRVVPFLKGGAGWNGDVVPTESLFISAVGAGTTYPDYKPAPFIVSSNINDVDMVTVVTEGIYSYCGVKIKIDTDRHIGPETSVVRSKGEPVGHVTTGEYGSQMLSIGGVNHLTGGTKKEGRMTCSTMLNLCNSEAVELSIDGGSDIVVEAGRPPIIDGVAEKFMRVGCGSATIGMFATQWKGLVDEVVIVDDHITGVVSEHQAGKVIDWPSTGIRINGRRSTPGRYFQVAEPGNGWGGTSIKDPLEILDDFNPKVACPGQSLLMISTTGDQFAYFELDENLNPIPQKIPSTLEKPISIITDNCEPALCTVLFVGGAGGSLRAGVTENPILLTRSVKNMLTNVTCGGASTYIWPGGGITLMVDVTKMPKNSFGYVPTPALVAPIEFSMRLDDYKSLGGHIDYIQPIEDALQGILGPQNDHVLSSDILRTFDSENSSPMDSKHFSWTNKEKT
jgi:hypothetical protein